MTEDQRKDLERKISVMQAHLDGAEIEYTHNHPNVGWNMHNNPSWDWVNCDYRVKQTLPSINWNHVAPAYKWLATDRSGSSYLYTTNPAQSNNCGDWIVVEECGPIINTRGFSSFKPGTCNWEDSLVERPSVEKSCYTCKHKEDVMACEPCSVCITNNTHEMWEPKS